MTSQIIFLTVIWVSILIGSWYLVYDLKTPSILKFKKINYYTRLWCSRFEQVYKVRSVLFFWIKWFMVLGFYFYLLYNSEYFPAILACLFSIVMTTELIVIYERDEAYKIRKLNI